MQQVMGSATIEQHRERVIDQLSSGFASDHLEVEEYERRVALAHDASSPGALDALVTDLVPVRVASTALVPARRLRVVFGSIERVGPWVVPSELSARVVCGSVVLDLRDAQLAPVTTIEVDITLGNVELLVPPGVSVEMDADPILGNVEDRTEPGLATNLVRVVGRVKLGNLEAWTLERGESKREARWRRWRMRRERRWQRRLDRHARRALRDGFSSNRS